MYSRAYQALRDRSPKTVIILGTGHQMAQDLFALSGKDFETPLGVAECDQPLVGKLKAAGGNVLAKNDFAHRAEHSIEFQVLFLQHILPKDSFTMVPILCGNLQMTLSEYSRRAYREKAGAFLEALKETLKHRREEALLVAGVDFSHIGPKFGHEMPGQHLKGRSEVHDKALLNHLVSLDADSFWEESGKLKTSTMCADLRLSRVSWKSCHPAKAICSGTRCGMRKPRGRRSVMPRWPSPSRQ